MMRPQQMTIWSNRNGNIQFVVINYLFQHPPRVEQLDFARVPYSQSQLIRCILIIKTSRLWSQDSCFVPKTVFIQIQIQIDTINFVCVCVGGGEVVIIRTQLCSIIFKLNSMQPILPHPHQSLSCLPFNTHKSIVLNNKVQSKVKVVIRKGLMFTKHAHNERSRWCARTDIITIVLLFCNTRNGFSFKPLNKIMLVYYKLN